MKEQIQTQVFNNLMQKLDIKPALTNVEKFNEWMRNRVKSIHYSNNNAMLNAFNKIQN